MKRMLMVLATTGLLVGAAGSVLAQARPVDGERGPRRREGSGGPPPSEEMRGWFRSLPEEERRKIMEKVGKLPPEERRAAIEKLARKHRAQGEKAEQPERAERGRHGGEEGHGPGRGQQRRRGEGERDRPRPPAETKRPAARKPAAPTDQAKDAALYRAYLQRLPEERRGQIMQRLKNASPEDRKRFREHAVKSMRKAGPGSHARPMARRPADRSRQGGGDPLRTYFRNLPPERREQIAKRFRSATPEVRAKFRERLVESMRKGGESRGPGMAQRRHSGENRGAMAGQHHREGRQRGRSARGPGRGRPQGMHAGARNRMARSHDGRHGRRGHGQMADRRGGMHRDGMHRAGMRHGGMQRGGMQRGGMQRGGMQRGGMQRGGMQRGGMQRGGMQRGGMQHGGMQRGGMQRGGMQRDGMQRGGMQRDGMQRGGMQRDGMRRGGMRGPVTPGPFGGCQDRMGSRGQPFRGRHMQTPARHGGRQDRARPSRGHGHDGDWMRWR